MEIKRVFRAFRYRPKHLLAARNEPLRQRLFPWAVGVAIVAMVVGGLWLTRVVERNISNALLRQLETVSFEVAPVGRGTNPGAERPAPRSERAAESNFEAEWLIRPVEFTEIVHGLGWLKHPRFGYWFYHDGFDVRAAAGAVVRAVAPGTVTEIIRDYAEEGLGISGNRITVTHGQRGRSSYIFPGRVEVSLGQTIGAGAALGVVGSQPGADPLVHIGLTWEGKDFDWPAVLENRG